MPELVGFDDEPAHPASDIMPVHDGAAPLSPWQRVVSVGRALARDSRAQGSVSFNAAAVTDFWVESKSRISFWKLFLTLVCATAVVYFLAPKLLFTYSEQAVTNAPLAMLRVSFPGTVETVPSNLGQQVRAGQVLATVANPAWDPAPLLDTEQRLRAAQSRVEMAGNEIAGLKTLRDRLRADYAVWRQSMAHSADLQVTEAQQRLDANKARLQAATTNLQRYNRVATLDLVSAQRFTDIRRDYDVAVRDELGSEAQVQRMQQYRQTLDSGISINENDRPPTLQRLDEIEMHLAAQTAALAAAEGDVQSLQMQRQERLRQRELETKASLTSPVDGVVWQVFARPGEAVQAHSEVINVLDCNRLGVTAIFNQRYVEKITPGRRVAVKLVGVNQRVYGHIERLNGYYKADDRVAEAVALKPVDDASVIAWVQLDEPMSSCLVGLKAVVQLD